MRPTTLDHPETGAASADPGPLIAVEDVSRVYRSRGRGEVRAVDGVSLALAAGEAVGLVGESGCGKSTLGRIVAQLDRPTTGRVLVEGRSAFEEPRRAAARLRREVQFVFQDPFSSLNPRRTVGASVAEPLVNARVERGERRRRVLELLDACGLRAELAERYPHELSGGQRQRVGIARALALRPKALVLDEPVSALDVSVQAQVVNLLADLRAEFGLAYLFISHDLGVVAHLCDRVVVMYRGAVVESGDTDPVFDAPEHPYTTALLSAVPLADPEAEARRRPVLLRGEAADDWDGHGCRFAPRCPAAQDVCADETPPPVSQEDGRFSVCHFPGALAGRTAD